MNESIKKYMKVGLVHFMAYPSTITGEGPIMETIKKIICDDYFDAIEVTWIKDTQIRYKVAQMLEASKLTVAYGAQPRLLTTKLNINDINDSKRFMAIESLKQGIDEAIELGAKSIAFLSGHYDEVAKEEAYQNLVKSTKEVCAYAKKRGNIKVNLEVFDYDIDKKSLIGPAHLAKRYVEEIRKDYDNFGLMVDLSHIPQLHETNEESLIPIKNFITHVHIGNCVIKQGCEAYGDTHPRFGFPNSENDVEELREFLKLLFEIGYLGEGKCPIVSFEVKPWGNEDPDVVIANAKRTLNSAWASL